MEKSKKSKMLVENQSRLSTEKKNKRTKMIERRKHRQIERASAGPPKGTPKFKPAKKKPKKS